MVEWSSNWRFSYESVVAVFVMVVVRWLSFVFAVAIFSFHFSTRSIYEECYWNANKFDPQPMIFHIAQLFNVHGGGNGRIALVRVYNVFFIIAISLIWCCLDSSVRVWPLTAARQWNGKREREKSPRLLTLDVVVACWNQDKCFPSTTMCLYNSCTKLSLLCSNFSTFPHFGRMCMCVCANVVCMCFFAGFTTHTKFKKFNGALFYLACHCFTTILEFTRLMARQPLIRWLHFCRMLFSCMTSSISIKLQVSPCRKTKSKMGCASLN